MAPSNYPEGMGTRDLMHVGEMEPDWCEDCPCESLEEPSPLNEYGEICDHSMPTCGCDNCDCSCHKIEEPDPDPREDDFDWDSYQGPYQ